MTNPLDTALADAFARFVAANPRSAALAASASEVLPGGNTRSVLHAEPFAIRVVGADGPAMRSADGAVVVDLLGDYSAGLVGRHPRVAAAIEEALRRGWSLGAMSEHETAFAEAIVARFPSIDRVRFTNSGSEANLMALLTARHVTGRERIVAFDGAYHGGPLNFAPGSEPLRVPFDLVTLPYNDVDTVDAEFARAGSRIAAALVEPMMGAAGCIPGDPEFLAAVRARCNDHGAVLVFDEVMTSRFAIGGAQERLGVAPDLTTLGKYFGGGLSFGAFGGAERLMAAYEPGGLAHGGTFNNNAFTMAVGPVVCELLDAATLATLNARGDRLRTALNDRFGASPLPFAATGVGSLLSIHPVAGPVRRPADLAAADPRWRALLFHDLLADGFYTAARGYLALSLEITDAHLDAFLDAVDAFLERRAGLAH